MKHKVFASLKGGFLAFCCALPLALPAMADDTEIFFAAPDPEATPVPPNVLFILDTSGSMINNTVPGSGGKTRLQVMKDALGEILDSATDVNVGLMRFTGAGGPVLFPVTPIDTELDLATPTTVRARLKEMVTGLQIDGSPGTPLVPTLYEAANYYVGGAVYYGKNRGTQGRYGRVSHPDSYTGGTPSPADCTDSSSTSCADEQITGDPIYKSPITEQCQTSNIVLLTDGKANGNGATSKIKDLISKSSCVNSDSDETCGRELAKWLATSDTKPVRMFTIGFNLDEGGNEAAIQFLKDLASNGKGYYRSASTASELVDVFNDILTSVKNTDTTFVSPAATVNQFNRLTHRNDIYFSVFKPKGSPMWPGNLKRYELKGDPAVIVDANNQPAVDAATGYFADGSKSFWSSSADGKDVTLGGAAEQLGSTSRKVYTYTGTTTDLTANSNKLRETNTSITKAMLGLPTAEDDYITGLLKWARGVDVKDWDQDGNLNEKRRQLGAPLHSQSVMITYGESDSQKNIVYFATNDGFLHAVDASNGKEKFAFIPRELLPNLDKFYTDESGTDLPYGLDGAITYWVDDANNDNVIKAADHDHVYLFVGMRRGGRNYYALDVSNPSAPTLQWTIKGGSDTDFAELGQTWSSAVHTKLDVDGTVTDVLIFGGGYDPAQDTNVTRTEDAQGRAVYIVNASNGHKIWSAGSGTFGDMKYSIPSDIRVLDINNDGLADQMYVADMGGQLWRFDLRNGESAAQLAAGGVIADLALNASGDNDAENNRRFYYAPDISFMHKDAQKFLAIAIGSGWRADPLNKQVQDRFYMIRVNNVYSAPEEYTKINETNLYNATDNVIGTGDEMDSAAAETALWSTYNGWYINLANAGEKVLAESLTVNHQILFTTFEPIASGNACSAGTGKGRLYMVSTFDATPVLDLNGDDSLTTPDRSTELAQVGIPPKPTVLFPGDPDGGNPPPPVLCVGAECGKNPDFGDIMKRTFWREVSSN